MKCTRDVIFGRTGISAASLRRTEPREIERNIHTNHASCNFFCHFSLRVKLRVDDEAVGLRGMAIFVFRWRGMMCALGL